MASPKPHGYCECRHWIIMEGERFCIGVVLLGFFGCLCNAQQSYKPSDVNSQALATTPWYHRKPVATQAPIQARPTFRRPVATQAPVPARPTFGKPAATQGPVTPRPTIGGPKGTTILEPPLPKPDSVKVQCGETSVQLEVDVDLLGIGNLIQPSDITLGGCGPVGQDHSHLLFETELHGCGSTLMVCSIHRAGNGVRQWLV